MKKSTQAFTLIELLAVIAILLILLSLLLPWVGRLIDNARFFVCSSNVRQMVAANVLYAGDNDGRLVGPNWLVGDYYEKGWLSSTNIWADLSSVEGGLMYAYLKEARIYRCPIDKQENAATIAIFKPYDTRMVTSYIMNGSVCDFGSRPYNGTTHLWETYRLSQFRQSDYIYWEGDENNNNRGDWWDGANSPNQGISGRHFGYNMVGCVDGHGERISKAEYYAIEAITTKNKLWNVPDSWNGH